MPRPTATRRSVLVTASALLAGCSGDGGGYGSGDGDASGGGDGSQDAGDDDGDEDAASGDDGGDGDGDDNPATGDVEQVGDLELTSPAFENGGEISERYGGDAEDVNPPLSVANAPADAESLALAMDDPDAVEPAGQVWDHWIVWNVAPDRTEIPEDWSPSDAEEGTNDSGVVGYSGPAPPDGAHRYRFKLFALDTTLDLPADTGVEALGEAMAGHVLARTQLEGTYAA